MTILLRTGDGDTQSMVSISQLKDHIPCNKGLHNYTGLPLSGDINVHTNTMGAHVSIEMSKSTIEEESQLLLELTLSHIST